MCMHICRCFTDMHIHTFIYTTLYTHLIYTYVCARIYIHMQIFIDFDKVIDVHGKKKKNSCKGHTAKQAGTCTLSLSGGIMVNNFCVLPE